MRSGPHSHPCSERRMANNFHNHGLCFLMLSCAENHTLQAVRLQSHVLPCGDGRCKEDALGVSEPSEGNTGFNCCSWWDSGMRGALSCTATATATATVGGAECGRRQRAGPPPESAAHWEQPGSHSPSGILGPPWAAPTGLTVRVSAGRSGKH